MKKVILHIPHSHEYIPEQYKHQYFGDIGETLLVLTDTYIYDLWNIDINDKKFVFPYSRIFCDVERLEENEPMEKHGQGILYTHDINGEPFRLFSASEKNQIMEDFYKPYHNRIREYIEERGCDVIIDCHSFKDNINYPDICIGFNGDKESKKYIDVVYDTLIELGYKVNINSPYSGSFTVGEIPSIMIEINKRLYLKDNLVEKTTDFYKTKHLTKYLLEKIKNV